MRDDKASRITAMARRSKSAVRTVPTSDHGRASCADDIELFERVSLTEGRVAHLDRLEAAAVCDGCPLHWTCGFRVAPPGGRTKGVGR
ncbi:hypothetical protein [Streptomyces sp. B6B3]|uniref:hypothetical protein n=1 Tax=Streptomyces sp. B6B3 TaxID=3153570 RepID=UPI00325CC028